MTTIKAERPDLVYFGGTTQSKGGQIAKDMMAVGLGCSLMVPDGCMEKAFIESAGAENLNPFTEEERKHLGNVYHLTKVRLSCRCKVAGDSSESDLHLPRPGVAGGRIPPPRRSAGGGGGGGAGS